MRFALYSFATLLAASTLSADVISGSVSCSSPSGDYYHLATLSQTSSRSCYVQTDITNVPLDTTTWSNREFSTASVSGTYSLSFNEVSGHLSGSTDANPHSTASATITFSDMFTTDGSVRDGLIRGTFFPDTFRYGGSASATMVSPTLRYATFGTGAPNITFVLGQPFTLTIVGTATALTDDGTASFSTFDIPFKLGFFEADGVTPVALTEVTAAPEPSTWGLLAGGILAFWLVRNKRLEQLESRSVTRSGVL